MDAKLVNQSLKDFITEKLLDGDGSELSDDTPLLELGIIDSMAMVSLLAHVQKIFGVKIPDDEVSPRNFQTIEALQRLILRVHEGGSQRA